MRSHQKMAHVVGLRLGVLVLACSLAGCGESSDVPDQYTPESLGISANSGGSSTPPGPGGGSARRSTPVKLDAGPPSVAASEVAEPIVPPSVEPKRVVKKVADPGPPSAAAAEAASFRKRRP
ncbi:MAG TPA: hypothetical protein VFT74_15510 [Isosphaeraceae bacterium]|nr:hypothetical protein [Isosphaeraceae bacterium]